MSKTIWCKGTFLLFLKSGYRFSLRKWIRDCHSNQLKATKDFLSLTGTAFLWHPSLPTPSAAPLFQRKVEQALTPAPIPALFPKANHVSKERIFFLTGSETYKDRVIGCNTDKEQENKKEWSYLLSVSVWYPHTGSGASYIGLSKQADNEERENEGIKKILISQCAITFKKWPYIHLKCHLLQNNMVTLITVFQKKVLKNWQRFRKGSSNLNLRKNS